MAPQAEQWIAQVSSANFGERRKEVWLLGGEYLDLWAGQCVDRQSMITRLYRGFREDVEADIARAAEALAQNPIDESLFLDDLKNYRRYLLGRYAFCSALRVTKVMRGFEPSLRWRLWGVKDFLMLRLGVGVFAGYMLLGSSSAVSEGLLKCRANSTAQGLVYGLAAMIIMSFALTDVQQRVGRRPWTEILGRSLWVAGMGVLYGFAGAFVHWRFLEILAWDQAWRPSLSLCAAAAVALGFVFQLFWQERSIAEPL